MHLQESVMPAQMIPDANILSTNLICDSFDNFQAEPAALLDATAIFITSVVWLGLDELINNVSLQHADIASATTQQHNKLVCNLSKTMS